jgi:glycosyltransferase involved in cell wall biosynthesis
MATLAAADTQSIGDTATSVVLCAYTERRFDQLSKAIQAVLDQTLAPDEVIVVVDHNDRLLELVRGAFPGVRAVANAGRQGLSGARNTGVSVSRSPIVAFLDDDALPRADWLAKLVEPYDDPSVVATDARCIPAWPGPRPRWFPAEFDWVVGCSYRGLPQTISEVRNPIGAAMSIRRTALEIAGPFREDIGRIGKKPIGCEETELAIRITQRIPGSRILHVPDAQVSHTVTVERERLAYFINRCHAEGLSKTLVTGSVGTGDGLASELRYTTRTLPLGVIRGIRDALRGDLAGLGRAAAIILGLSTTTLGYAHGLLGKRAGR